MNISQAVDIIIIIVKKNFNLKVSNICNLYTHYHGPSTIEINLKSVGQIN